MVPFPLYHGTSSHYLAAFKPGAPPAGWPHKDLAITLLRNAWHALRSLGSEPDWYIERILDQTSGPSNWQHGDLYVTPSRQTAVMYAGANAAYGGELVTFCKNALDLLAERDPLEAERLLHNTGSIVDMLSGNGAPILVEIVNVSVEDLLPERTSDNVVQALAMLDDLSGDIRDALAQQMNFRLCSGSGVVDRIFYLEIDCPGDPCSAFTAVEIST